MILFPSQNEFDVPDLVLDDEPSVLSPGVDTPIALWGAVARTRKMLGLWMFYVDDHRFQRLFREPDLLVSTGCAAAVEVNFSVQESTPRAQAIWEIYRKRWLARYWQEVGVQIWVDLYVSEAHRDIALLGVPKGWQRFATHGSDGAVGSLDVELEMAVEQSNGAAFTLLVYGGGAGVQAWCKARANVVHVPHRRSAERRPGPQERQRIKEAKEENAQVETA